MQHYDLPTSSMRSPLGVPDMASRQSRHSGGSHDWSHIAEGILCAGASYPIVSGLIGAVMMIWDAIANYDTGPTSFELGDSLGESLSVLLLGSVLGALFALAWTVIAIAVTLPIVNLIVRSIDLKANPIWLGAFAGGLTGFVALLPLTFELPRYPGKVELDELLFVLALGPGLTTILGQIGGAWGGRRASWYERAVAAATVCEMRPTVDQVTVESQFDGGPSTTRTLQFRIRHLLCAAVWLSLLLSVIRLSGIPYALALPLLTGWLVYQAATLWIGWHLARWLGPRWSARRENRST